MVDFLVNKRLGKCTDSRFRETTVRCRVIKGIKSKKWEDVYKFLEMKGLLNEKQ